MPAADAVVWDASLAARGSARSADVPAPATTKHCPHCAGEYRQDLKFCPLDGSVLRAPTVENDLVGQIIADRYLVLSKLGAGGMGQVYLAEHVRLGRRCALKVLNVSLISDVDAVARFDREATNLSRITHPHIATIYDFGETSDGVYLAMEYIEGESLAALLARERFLAPGRAVGVVNQIADALTAAHAIGIIHRDLKPDNVMVGRNRDGSDCIKVVDFGISKAVQAASQRITSTGLVIGTPAYMSPEQLAGDPTDHRSDVYSLGLIAFELLTGAQPFPSSADAMLARLALPPRTLAESRPEIAWPAALEEVLHRVLAPMPEKRFQTTDEFARALAGACAHCDPGPDAHRGATTAPSRPVRRTAMWTAAALVGAAALVSLGSVGWHRLASARVPADGTIPVTRGASDVPTGPSVAGLATASASSIPRDTVTASGGAVAAATSPRPTPGRRAADHVVAPAPSVARPPASDVPEQLERLRAWTDPESGNEASARRALAAVPALLPRVSSSTDSVAAEYYGAQAYLLLGDEARACSTLQRIAARAARHPYLANAVHESLADTSLHCR